MSLKVKERKVQLPMQRREASFTPASFNKETRTIELVWSVGSKGLRYLWGIGTVFEELSMDSASVRMGRLESGRSPFCDVHNSQDTKAVLGVIVSAKIEDGVGTCVVRLVDPETLENPDAKDTIRKIENGILQNVSVGYNVYTYERQPMVEGEDTPTYLATDWEPMEVSIVPIGFDENATVRSKEASAAECVIINNLPAERNEEARKMDEEQKKKLEQERAAAELKAKEEAKAAAEKARAEEKTRQIEIRGMATKLGLGEEFVTEMSSSDHSLDAIRALAIDAKSKTQIEVRNASVVITAGEDSAEKWQRGASSWLIQRAGLAVAQAVEKQSGQRSEAGEFRGMSLYDLARESLERAGVKTRGMDKMTLVGRAFTHRSTGMQTASDFAVLLENTIHKILLANYAITPNTWKRFCKTGSLTDFRPHPRYRKGSFGALDSIGEHGEFKAKSVPDGKKESITGATKGNIIALSRQTIINDDMGAFSDLAMDLGQAAMLTIELDVYALLAMNGGLGPVMNDGNTLFHASHGNIGTGAALSAASTDADRVLMGSQTDVSGNQVLDLSPAILLVPKALGGQARVINMSQYDPDNVASGSKAVMKPNVVAGLFKDIVDTARISGTRRYAFADPSVAPTIEVAFLDGQEAPFLESQDGWKIDGVEWKVREDYGVGAIDYRGATTNAGQ